MEKKFRPVPDVDALRYKGTPGKPDIKIFVSHRIDLDSETIDNPLYIPVRCGAVYDKREGVTMLGDDTGDNISERRESFCELTVQYWAWKNIDADYYGICHYRRFLSFSPHVYETATWGNQNTCVLEPCISENSIKKYCLQEEIMRKEICSYDIIVNEKVDIHKTSPFKNGYDTIKSNPYWHNIDDYDNACKILLRKYPEFKDAVNEFNMSSYTRMYSCFIMKKKLFHQYCEWLYSILFELEPLIDIRYYSTTQARAIGTISEKLFAIYCIYLKNDSTIRFKENQLVFFEHPEKQVLIQPAYKENNIAAVVMCSNYYVPYFSVLLESILQQTSSRHNYDIIVLHKSMATENQSLLKSMCKQYSNVSLRFYCPLKEIANVEFNIASPTYSEEAYYRVLVPWILSSYDKAVILDSDLIFMHDIAELYNLEFGRNDLYLATKDYAYYGWMNIEPKQKQYAIKTLKLKNPYNYVNTGVMVANLAGIRDYISMEDLLKKVSGTRYQIQEQDAINVIYEDKIGNLDLEWNYYVECNETIKCWIDASPVENYKKYLNTVPYVYHYANQPKPWNVPEIREGHRFWSIARKSLFYETLISRMSQSYVGNLHYSVHNLQSRIGAFDTRSGVRKLADKLLPLGSRRREFAKFLLPKGSLRWRFCKQIYFIIKPSFRPTK